MIVEIIEYANNVSVEVTGVTLISINEHNIPAGLPVSAFTQKGGLLVGSGNGTVQEFPPGADGEFLKYDSASPLGVSTGVPSLQVDDVSNGLINGGHDFAERQTPGTFTGIGSGKYSSDRWRVEWEFPAAAANWQASFNYALNNVAKPTVYNGFYYKVTTDAGSSGGSQPTWPKTPGATVVDGGITWTCMADVQYARQNGSAEAGLTSPYFGQWKRVNNAGKFLIFQPLEYMDTVKYSGRTIIFQNQLKASSSKTLKMAILELQSGTEDILPSPLVTSWNADGSDPTFGSNLAVIATAEAKTVGTAMAVFSFSGTFPTNSKNLLCAVWTDSAFAVNDTFSQAEAGLYYGASQLAWTPRHVIEELQRCRRFYEKSYGVNVAPGYSTSSGAEVIRQTIASETASLFNRRFLVTKRFTPTVEWYNPNAPNDSGKIYSITGSATRTVTGTYSNDPVSTMKTGSPTHAAAGSAGDILWAHWTADAEL